MSLRSVPQARRLGGLGVQDGDLAIAVETAEVAERLTFDLERNLGYRYPQQGDPRTDRALADRDDEPAHLIGHGPVPAPIARELLTAEIGRAHV